MLPSSSTSKIMEKRQSSLDPSDRISKLSDVILIYILSFLPTKYAVRTSVLSTRWKPLWTSVPILDLSYNDFPSKRRAFVFECSKGRALNTLVGKRRRKAKFLTFVYRFLMQQPSLQKVHLRGMRYDLSIIKSWISLLRKHNVQVLKLDTYFHVEPMESPDDSRLQDFAMYLSLSFHRLDHLPGHEDKFSYSGNVYLHNSTPSTLELLSNVTKEWNVKDLELDAVFYEKLREFHPSMFANEALVVLKLRENMVLNFPKCSIRFPHLKVLHLKGIKFKNNRSWCNLITTGCPVLEELDMSRCSCWDNIIDFTIMSRTLKRLKLRFEPEYCRKRNLKTLIDAPNLQYLDLRDDTTLNYVIGDLSSLAEAELGIWIKKKLQHCDETAYGNTLFVLLRKICSVEFLSLSVLTLRALQKASSWYLLMFQNLSCLKLCLSTFEPGLEYVSWKLILKLLMSSPNLKHLIWQGTLFEFSGPFDMTSQDELPPCVVSHLQEIEIESYWGGKKQIKLVQYFLKNSRALKMMRIKFANRSTETEVMKQAILDLPKVSTACQIEIGIEKYGQCDEEKKKLAIF